MQILLTSWSAFFAMLDIRLLREQPDLVKVRLATRGAAANDIVDALLTSDAQRRAVETSLQALQAEKNRLSREIGNLRSRGQDTAALEMQVSSQAAKMQELSKQATDFEAEQRSLELIIPNLPRENVPAGADSSQNVVVRTWGEKPNLAKTEDHRAIGSRLNLLDFDRAARMSGGGFVCYKGKGARLERALIDFLVDLHSEKHGYQEISPPFLVRAEALVGTSQLPKFGEQVYGIERDGLYLTPTAEVPLTNLHREELLPYASLPLKYVAYTPCFRREAGAAGVGTRGLIRMHQFDKVELVKICPPESSATELETLTNDAERVLQILGLHYRVLELCTGDLGFGAAKTYDIEVWAPGQNAYLEVSSCSDFTDFQARRMNLRFKDQDGKNRFCHTLNGSGTALARLYVALVETGRRPDGTIALPEALHSYFGGDSIE
jgi:seryl-tRNA synthetase